MNVLNNQLRGILVGNTANAQKKFIEKLTMNMTEADGEGHVYGFIPHGCPLKKSNFRMKLGRTQKYNPEDRVKEWGGKLVFSVRTVCNKKLERLVHLIFDKWHINVFNEATQKNEIEWFHFTENIPVATIVNMLNDVMSSMHMNDDDVEDEDDVESNVEIVPQVSQSNAVISSRFVPISQSNVISGKVNINIATQRELENIPGIGEKLAARIIKYRKSERFQTIEDIMNVPYIKEGVFNKCKHTICV